MKRRALFQSAAAASLLAAARGLRAQTKPPPAPRRIAVLTVADEPGFAVSLQAIRDGLRSLGHVEGQDVALDVRYARGRAQDLSGLAAELAALGPVAVIATGKQATDAVLAADPSVPVVSLGDLVAAGHATQLGRPGGRVTGVSFLPIPLNAKRLELLAEVLPARSAVLNLVDPSPLAGTMQSVAQAGAALGLTMHAAYARTPAEIVAAFADARRLRVAGLNVLNSPFLSAEHPRIIRLAAEARLPAIYQWPESARDGGLMGYGPSLTAMFRQLAVFASRIANGARPGDLPIEQPTRLELAINLRTARALGIAMPRSLLQRADHVMQ